MNEWQKIWHDLSSMHTALILMALIIAVAVAATIAFPAADVFHAVWFQVLLGLFCLNMTLCIVRQVRVLWRIRRSAPPVAPQSDWHQTTVTVAGGSHLLPRLEKFLAARHFRYTTVTGAGETLVYADRGMLGRWSTLAVHGAILLIALGACIGHVGGFNTTVNVGVGDSVPLPRVRGGEPAEIRLNDFQVDYYADGSVSEYTSDVTVTGGTAVRHGVVRVNHPLQFNHIVMYQMSCGYQVRTEQFSDGGGVVSSVWLDEDGMLSVDGQRAISLQMIKYVPDFDPRHPAVSRSPLAQNPKVLYVFYQNDQAVDWGIAEIGQHLRLSGTNGWLQFSAVRPYSSFAVKYDPGLPLVFTGFGLLSLAFLGSMLLRYHQLWIKLAAGTAGVHITAAVGRLPQDKSRRLMEELAQFLVKGDKG